MLRLLSLLLLCALLPPSSQAFSPEVPLVEVHGPINPVTADYLRRNIEEAGRRGNPLLVIQMDTPGGLDSAMRQTVQAIFSSSVPVAVFVAPSGSRAASAGAVIALAADLLAMAPGTNIGAAHPVSMGGSQDKVMEAKVLNDAEAYVDGIAARRGRNVEVAREMVRDSISLPAEKALQEKVIDLIAVDRADLLKKLDGWRLARGGKETVLRLSGARIVRHEMGSRDRILDAVSSPDIAYLLMMLGFAGIFFELANPGVILPGVVGGIAVILAFFGLQTLPVNYAGVLLILLAIILFIAEVKVVSHGILGIGGTIALVLGSLLLFPSDEPYLRLSWWVLGGTVLFTTLFFSIVVAKVIEAHRQKPVTGREGMIGEHGIADTDLTPEGRVVVRGEYWNATGIEPIRKGEKVVVTDLEGLRVTVKKLG